MKPKWSLLKCIAKALLKNAGKPFGLDFVGEVLHDSWENWDKRKEKFEAVQELQSYAQARLDEFLQGVSDALTEVEGEFGKRFEQAERRAYEAWLAQVPGRIQAQWRRPSDPSGTTVPDGTVLQSAVDLEPFVPPSLPRFVAGDRVHGYTLEKPLGGGGFSDVWLARKSDINKQSVLKFNLAPEEIEARSFGQFRDVNPLQHEAAIHQRLRAHNITEGILLPTDSFLDAARSQQCLVFDYAPAGDVYGFLADLHAGGKPAAHIIAESSGLMLTLCRYLEPCHRAGIIHRDLKPANILFLRDGSGRLRPMLADFGIGGLERAKLPRTNQTTTSLAHYQTALMQRSFTQIYASPQQRAGLPPTAADDVFSLGRIWYELLSGDKLHLEPEFPSDWEERLKEKGIGADFINLIRNCIARPEKRFTDAGHLRQEIQKVLDANDQEIQKKRNEEAAREAARRAQIEHDARIQAANAAREIAQRQAEIDRRNKKVTHYSAYGVGSGLVLSLVVGGLGGLIGWVGMTNCVHFVIGLLGGGLAGALVGALIGALTSSYVNRIRTYGDHPCCPCIQIHSWKFGTPKVDTVRGFAVVAAIPGAIVAALAEVGVFGQVPNYWTNIPGWTAVEGSLGGGFVGAVLGLILGLIGAANTDRN